ncbi:uncharacterized protein NPIL_227041 [Nephila pilipes]|uniref:Uncharacterized protein n=1 Tax=Nephila pilipes TaxID=299642 RepID=A0A8X6PWY0_NEPPI|nr:uncharacterized protein NPIL_227041 [Nephila pilipes]
MHRFLFACEYYFEEDAQKLWTNMLEYDRLDIRMKWQNNDDNRHWLSSLENRIALDWEQFTLNARDDEFFIRNINGIPYFLTRLQDREIRYQCIASCLEIVSSILSPLYLCLFQMNSNELNYMFTRLPSDLMRNVFESFLHWPLQINFLDMVNSFKTHINGEIFLSSICVLLDKLECGREDYEYEDLLQSLWMELSSQYVSFVEQYKVLSKIVKYVLNASIPFNTGECEDFISKVREEELNGEERTLLDIFNP